MADKLTFICPTCGDVDLAAEHIRPRCKTCRILMEKCGNRKDFVKLRRLSVDERKQIANSDTDLP